MASTALQVRKQRPKGLKHLPKSHGWRQKAPGPSLLLPHRCPDPSLPDQFQTLYFAGDPPASVDRPVATLLCSAWPVAPEPFLMPAGAHWSWGCGGRRVPLLGLNMGPVGGGAGLGAQGPADSTLAPRGEGAAGQGQACTQSPWPPAYSRGPSHSRVSMRWPPLCCSGEGGQADSGWICPGAAVPPPGCLRPRCPRPVLRAHMRPRSHAESLQPGQRRL